MSFLGDWAHAWLATFRRQPVRFHTPLSRDEVMRRLAKVTSERNDPGYIGKQFAAGPPPVLIGQVDQGRISVRCHRVAAGRSSEFPARLTAVAEPAPGGGTAVTGTVTMQRLTLISRIGFVIFGVGTVVLMRGAGPHSRALIIGAVFWFGLTAIVEAIGPIAYKRNAGILLALFADLTEAAPLTATPPEVLPA
jgi:hypothetical protein